eukprot:scaffold28361_cov129-Isochrysis_galbana.AAC.1
MTDPPTDDTEAREPDAPGATDAKHRAPVHGHTGDVPSHKALSDTAGCTPQKPCTRSGAGDRSVACHLARVVQNDA